MAIAATYRAPYFYDLPGAYNRYLFDAQGKRRGVSPEWRGLLQEDYTLTYLLSHSYREERGSSPSEDASDVTDGACGAPET